MNVVLRLLQELRDKPPPNSCLPVLVIDIDIVVVVVVAGTNVHPYCGNPFFFGGRVSYYQ